MSTTSRTLTENAGLYAAGFAIAPYLLMADQASILAGVGTLAFLAAYYLNSADIDSKEDPDPLTAGIASTYQLLAVVVTNYAMGFNNNTIFVGAGVTLLGTVIGSALLMIKTALF